MPTIKKFEVGDKLTLQYITNNQTRHGTITKIHSDGRFSVKPQQRGHCLNFRADGTHERYTISSIERPLLQAVRCFEAENHPVNEHQKTRELIALSSLLLRLGQIMERNCSDSFDYFFECKNSSVYIAIDHCDEGFEYTLSTDSVDMMPRPLKNVSMLNSLLLYGEES